jgi:hypothetical protein
MDGFRADVDWTLANLRDSRLNSTTHGALTHTNPGRFARWERCDGGELRDLINRFQLRECVNHSRRMRDTATTCASPTVAVCVVGQLRAASRGVLPGAIRRAWDRVGPDCVDIYLSIGIEPVLETNNHPGSAAKSYANVSMAVSQLRPVEWHVSSLPLRSHAAPGLSCVRRPGEQEPETLCHKGPSAEASYPPGETCADNCSHCAVTNYYGNYQRISSCAAMVMDAQARLGRRYEYFVYHRPDLLLYGMPPYPRWRFDAIDDAALARSALFCAPTSRFEYPQDFFGVISFRHISIVAEMASFAMECQSRRRNVQLGCRASGWPAWHTAECLLHAAFARRGVRVRALTTDELWPAMRRSCRIVRDRNAYPRARTDGGGTHHRHDHQRKDILR